MKFKVTRTSTTIVEADSEDTAIDLASSIQNTGIFGDDRFQAWQTLDGKPTNTQVINKLSTTK